MKSSVLYRERVEHNDQLIEFTIIFNKDTTNWATLKPKKIGYEVIVIPIEITIECGIEIKTIIAFSGFTDNLLEVNRQSQKRLSEAISILTMRKESYLKQFNNKRDE